jgi:hypothetical protein
MLRDGQRVAVGRPRELARRLAGRVLDVRAARPEAVIAALRGTPLVASTTQLGDTAHVLLRPDAPPAGAAAESLARALAEAGLPGARLEPSAVTLEDVFVALLLGERLEDPS